MWVPDASVYLPVQMTEVFCAPGAVTRRPGHTDLGVPCRSSAVSGVRPPRLTPGCRLRAPAASAPGSVPWLLSRAAVGGASPRRGDTGGPMCPGTSWAWILQVARSCQPRGERESRFGLSVWPIPVSSAMLLSRGVSSPLGENVSGVPTRGPSWQKPWECGVRGERGHFAVGGTRLRWQSDLLRVRAELTLDVGPWGTDVARKPCLPEGGAQSAGHPPSSPGHPSPAPCEQDPSSRGHNAAGRPEEVGCWFRPRGAQPFPAAGAVHSAGCMPEPQFPTCPGAPARSWCRARAARVGPPGVSRGLVSCSWQSRQRPALTLHQGLMMGP